MTEAPKEPFKNLLDFIHTTLGRSPGGYFLDNTLIINQKDLTPAEFKRLAWAFVKYREDWPESKLPNIEFRLSSEKTFEEKMIESDKTKTIVGDTVYWR